MANAPQRLSVSAVTKLVKRCLEDALAPLWVEGEVSNFVAHSSGHFYFSMKDAGAQLRCVMFRGANHRLRFRPEDGIHCAAFGRITVYERSGQYQLIVERLLPVGEGALQLALEQLKARLDAEGLFDPTRKRSLPEYPETIGVVTSPTGAAVRDIVRVLRRRWPAVRIVLAPVRVQGEGAAEEIAAAIAAFNHAAAADVLIVGRGGGSLEDLWAFNEEIVARALAASRIPTISAVGHEIDITIADFVADLRAPTPSAAAEVAVRDVRDVLEVLEGQIARCDAALLRRVGDLRLKLDGLGRSRALQSPLDRTRQEGQRADEMIARIGRALEIALERLKRRLSGVGGRLTALNPEGVLERGYALAFDGEGGLLRRADQVTPGDRILIHLGYGRIAAVVERCEKESHGKEEG